MVKIEVEVSDRVAELLERGFTPLAVRMQPPRGMWPLWKVRRWVLSPSALQPVRSFRAVKS